MMTAAAQSLDDEPQDDPAEAPMSAADFEIIRRAHEICGHAAAVDLEQCAASTSAAAICQRLCDELLNEGSLLRALVDAETKPTAATYWQQIATAAWCGKSWKAAAVEYQVTRRNAYAWVRR